jgi:hypothetical protein
VRAVRIGTDQSIPRVSLWGLPGLCDAATSFVAKCRFSRPEPLLM